MKTITKVFFTALFLFSMLGLIGSNAFPVHLTFAQPVNDRDNDGIEDDMDSCPDNSDLQCITPESPDQLPGINAPLDQDQVKEIPGGELPVQPENGIEMASQEICDNTIDDDQDSLIDSDDPDCSPPIETSTTAGQGIEEGQQNTEVTTSNVCTPNDQSTDVCNPDEQKPTGDTPPLEATGDTPPLEATGDTPPLEATGDIPPSEATNSICTPNDQSTNVCNPDEQKPTGETPLTAPTGEGQNGLTSPPPTPTSVTTSTCDPKSKTMLFGDEGPKVIEIQTYLTKLGYGELLGKHGPNQVGIDGKFEADTKKAVIRFQENNHLKKIDGKVGPETWSALCAAVNSVIPGTPEMVLDLSGCTEINGRCVMVPGSESDMGKILNKLQDLALAAKNEGNLMFHDAVIEFRNVLKSQLLANKLPQSSSGLAIAFEALKLWVGDSGNTWGTSDDTGDFKSGAGCYATVPGGDSKCNIYVAEVIYLATGVTFKADTSSETGEEGKYIPFRAADWANMGKPIPNFIIDNVDKQMGDVWAAITNACNLCIVTRDHAHVGIYLGEYKGVKLYISARADGNGVYGLNTVQHENGIQIKELVDPGEKPPKGGVYREYASTYFDCNNFQGIKPIVCEAH